jgi:hypothetical protein
VFSKEARFACSMVPSEQFGRPNSALPKVVLGALLCTTSAVMAGPFATSLVELITLL